jgi:hypothetical protein
MVVTRSQQFTTVDSYNSYNSVIKIDRLEFDDSCDMRLKTCRDGNFLMETQKRQRGNSLSF